VKAKGAHNLIIDLRDNGGESSTMGDCLFPYMYSGKFRCFRQIRMKISWEALRELPWFARRLAIFFRGHVIPLSVGEHSARKPDASFSGRVFVLTDNGTYFMAGLFAAMVRDYKAGTTVGYETGSLPLTPGGPHHLS
jgi:hypothetical protein